MAAMSPTQRIRCGWSLGSPAYIAYHDEEWGVPVHDDRTLFEFLVLEGAQAGLSWSTILHKRENYRRAFDRFDPEKVARYDRRRIAKLLADPGIVRNRLKVESAVSNARAFLAVRERGQIAVGITNTTHFLRPEREGRLQVIATAVHQGRSTQLWEVEIVRADDGRAVARGSVRLQNVDG